MKRPRLVVPPHLFQDILNLSTVGPCVHPERPPHRSRDIKTKFQSFQTGLLGVKSHLGHGGHRTGSKIHFADRYPTKRFPHPHDHPSNPAVPDQEIGPRPESKNGNAFLPRLTEDYPHFFRVLGFDKEVGLSPHLVGGKGSQGIVAFDPSGERLDYGIQWVMVRGHALALAPRPAR